MRAWRPCLGFSREQVQPWPREGLSWVALGPERVAQGRPCAALMGDIENAKDYVKLISAEGFEFFIHREAAVVSGTLKGMLGTSAGEVRFPEISTPILEKLCQYFYYRIRYSNPANQKTIPEFKIEPEIALELHMVANYMET